MKSRSPTPMVSVVMPVYNGEPYLLAAVDSVLAQTFADFEFIIIDDGSKDDSFSIINSYNDDRIKTVQIGRKGRAAALNHGVEFNWTKLLY